jgi:hypothetical protein
VEHPKVAKLGQASALLTNIRLGCKRPARDKHSIFLRTFVNYGRKFFYNIELWPCKTLANTLAFCSVIFNIPGFKHPFSNFSEYTLFYETFEYKICFLTPTLGHKHTNLLQCDVFYNCAKFYVTGPGISGTLNQKTGIFYCNDFLLEIFWKRIRGMVRISHRQLRKMDSS